MPNINVNVDTYIDIDIDVLDVLEECSDKEIKDVLDYLEENNFIKSSDRVNKKLTISEINYNNLVARLSNLYLQLKKEDLHTLEMIIAKY